MDITWVNINKVIATCIHKMPLMLYYSGNDTTDWNWHCTIYGIIL